MDWHTSVGNVLFKVHTLKMCDTTQIYSVMTFTLLLLNLNFRFSPPLKYTSQPRGIFADPKSQKFIKKYIGNKNFRKVQNFQNFFQKNRSSGIFADPKILRFFENLHYKIKFHKVQNFFPKNRPSGIFADPKTILSFYIRK